MVSQFIKRSTNWYVITGGPGSGKTTVVNLLRGRGYNTTIEHARHYLYTQQIRGKTIEEARKNKEEFQLAVLEMQIEQEASLSPDEIVFLDRAIPDCLAYYKFLGLSPGQKLLERLEKVSYRKVFIMDLLPLVNDIYRKEDETTQRKIHKLIFEVYRGLQLPCIRVPVLPPEERTDFILSEL